MGQNHSSPRSDAGDPNDNGAKKKDYYELLEVEQNASPEEIKKAYRKKALELHPDRNYGNVEAATSLFAEIQAAYEVLSDPQERSWYDSHRDAFLGAGAGGETSDYSYNTRMTTSADVLRMFSKFSPQMDFTDSPGGFYGGLREKFAQLAREEEMACRWENLDIIELPSFGSRDDDLRVVRQFYAVWSSFSTKKSFSWKDVYRYSEAPDRRVRRLMEKENRRLREAAIREFNEAVRSLVAFAKKRDPRYKSYKDSQSQQRDMLRQSAAEQAARSRAANHAKLRDHISQDWAKSEEPEYDLTESSEVETEHFECIVCHKTFKSKNQFQTHERSKKHLKAVKQLRWEMKMEDEEFKLQEDSINDDSEAQAVEAGTESHETIPAQTPLFEQKLDFFERGMLHDDPKLSSAEPNSNTVLHSIEVHQAGSSSTDKDEPDYAPREILEERFSQGDSSNQIHMGANSPGGLSGELSALNLSEDGYPVSVKLGKARQKRAKKAQLAAEKSQPTKCAICNALFASRNKLFSHIKIDHRQR
ncbi:hypothetical protein BJX61DRAFT_148465 [Aspergillus egyptiacus]|nr:hypothetical protein BJX61DRAFT_148465 [Aspergillus egyptiacus]